MLPDLTGPATKTQIRVRRNLGKHETHEAGDWLKLQPIKCKYGKWLHECDVVLASYEQLIEEFGKDGKRQGCVRPRQAQHMLREPASLFRPCRMTTD